MKIKLLKNLHHNGTFHQAGEEVEVDKPTYDYIMGTYLEERKVQAAKEAEAKKIVDVLTSEPAKKGEK